ncbi:aminoglycoside adenylyltransferase domain-containing protein [Sporosarcina sp. USHLN248]|uniref:aminoglycoside adenylyltransferase domain-containing protein n=1 Tax=Sporosarcina sp. USHLN248 TaxID=3081300 RepID=UPI003016F920
MDTKKTLDKISNEYQKILRNNLVGIYVHGSIAFGCFNPNKSDIDFIVVVDESPSLEEKIALINVLLKLSSESPANGFEMSVVLLDSCQNFAYPTPFVLHYSKLHMQQCLADITSYSEMMNGTDKDLAAHFTVIKNVGLTLFGKPIDDVFGVVPENDYVDSIRFDIANAENEIFERPVYIILNLCRVYAYKHDRLILSKEQGGMWGIQNLDHRYSPIISTALRNYKKNEECAFDVELLKEFSRYMSKLIFN